MKKNDDVELADRRVGAGEIARRREVERLAEVARNLESLGKLAAIQASEGEQGESTAAPDMATEAAAEPRARQP